MLKNIKEFIEYLLYIGITSNETMPILTKIIEENFLKNNLDKDCSKISKEQCNSLIKSIMGQYFQQLDSQSLFKLGEIIYENYYKNKFLLTSKILLPLIYIKRKQEIQKIQYYFIVWKYHLDLYSLIPNQEQIPNFKSKKILTKSNEQSVNSNINFLFEREHFMKKLFCYENKKEKAKQKLIQENDEDASVNCTFSPNLSLTLKKNVSFCSKYQNKIHLKNSLNNINIKKNEESIPKHKPNKERIIKLYKDYQNKNKVKEKLLRKINSEKGITFFPRVNKEYNSKKILNHFYERNKKSIEKKQKYLDINNNNRNKEIKKA